MAVQPECRRCGAPLTQVDELGQASIHCPRCGQLNQPSDPIMQKDVENWWMRTPEGKVYGPVTRLVLDRWMLEGRIAVDCDLRHDGDNWLSAAEIYSELIVVAEEIGNPFATETRVTNPNSQTPRVESNRGGLILGLGVLGILVPCPLLGGCAWVMGNADLRKIYEGRMDSQRLNFIRIGRMIGLVMTLIWLVFLAVTIFLLLLRLVTN